jgi:hypothetical protein
MQQTRFAARLGRRLGRHVDAACAVRPPGTTLTTALCAGAGAGIGALVGNLVFDGSAIFGGIGGFLGALLGYLVNWRIRGSDQAVTMALVLGPDGVELLRLGVLGTKPVATLRSIRYADMRDVAASERMLEVRIVLQTTQGEIELEGARRGVGAAPPVVDELRRRIAA